MAGVSNYNKINRFWGSDSVSAARKIGKSTGKSQKDSTCEKLNNLLKDHHNAGIIVIKALVDFKKARDDSWFCAGRADQSNQLTTIDNILKPINLSDLDNNYPTLEELEVLVKNSSYFVQRDIPTHFKNFLIELPHDVKNQITDVGNQRFLQDNSIIDKAKSKTKSTIQRSAERGHSLVKSTKAELEKSRMEEIAQIEMLLKNLDNASSLYKTDPNSFVSRLVEIAVEHHTAIGGDSWKIDFSRAGNFTKTGQIAIVAGGQHQDIYSTKGLDCRTIRNKDVLTPQKLQKLEYNLDYHLLGGGFNDNQKKCFHLARSRLWQIAKIPSTTVLLICNLKDSSKKDEMQESATELNNKYKEYDLRSNPELRQLVLDEAATELRNNGETLNEQDYNAVKNIFMSQCYQW